MNPSPAPHADLGVSPWVQRWSHLVSPGARVLDVACGSGRHVRWFAQRGCSVTAIDRDSAAVAPLRSVASVVLADLEATAWPLPGQTFDAVLVTNYLWRPLLPTLVTSLAPHGVLICETFALGQQTVGRPANPAFLLGPGELLSACAGLRIVTFEDGFVVEPDRFVQRIVAVREVPDPAAPPRYALAAGAASAAPLKCADHEGSA
jgi:SAM-dependent methyltransferase